MSNPVVFIVDHDQAFLELMNEALSDEGFTPAVWGEFSRAYELIRCARPSSIVLEISPVDPDAGCAVLSQLQRDEMTMPVPVLVTTTDRTFLERRLAHLNIDGSRILAKPFDLDDLLARLRHLLLAPVPVLSQSWEPVEAVMALS